MRNQPLQEAAMEYATIEREIHIDATPEIVFEVISSSEHLQEWWPDEAHIEAVPGAVGDIVFVDHGTDVHHSVPFTVVDVQPHSLFSFRWVHPAGEAATASNSFLVTFELAPAGGGTSLRMTEVGFREQGWEAAVLEAHYQDHVQGWDTFIPRLGEYVATLVASR
jgi:uncharacterized protein YndB with AHSA1/START domain